MSSQQNLFLMIRIMFPFCLGYMLAFFAQNISAALTHDFSQKYALQLNTSSILTSVFFLAFAMSQIPLGILLDRYNPARVKAAFLLLAALGALLISSTKQTELMALGRILLGFGVSACLMAAYRAIYDHFPTAQIPLMNSIVLAFGGLGAIISGWPHLIQYILNDRWRDIFAFLSLAFVSCALLLFFCLPKPVPVEDTEAIERPQFGAIEGIVYIMSAKNFWMIMPTLATLQGLLLSITSLWIVPWLLQVESFTMAQIPIMLVLVSAVMTLGYILSGWMGSLYAGTYERMQQIFLIGSIIAVTALMMICFVPINSPLILWVCFMLFAPASVLGFPLILQCFPAELAGRAITLLNFFVFLCAFTFQWITGAVLGMFNAENYEVLLFAYRMGFSIPAALCLLAIISFAIMLTETK